MDQWQQTEAVKLRKISSLESSPLFPTSEEKLQELRKQKENPTAIPIPTYPKAKPYKNSQVKSLFARSRYFGAILQQRLLRKDYPLICVVVVNNHCNWNCTYCFGDYPNRRDLDYTTDELKYLIEQLYKMGVRYVNLHGGETLLRKDVGEIIGFAKGLGLYVCVITNGSLLKEKLIEVRAVDNLTISLDGTKENNDKVRGQGTFDTALSAIRLAVKEGLSLRVSATLTKYTMHDVGYLAKLAQEEGFHLYFSLLFKPLKQGREAQMSPADIRQSLKEIQKYKDLGYPIFTTDRSLRASYEWPYDYNETYHVPEEKIPASYRPFHIPCYYGRSKFTIEADGYIYPCFLTTDGSFTPLNWKVVGVKKAIQNVQERNTCRACPAMSQNDHSALLGLNFKHVAYILKDQLQETLHIKNKVRES